MKILYKNEILTKVNIFIFNKVFNSKKRKKSFLLKKLMFFNQIIFSKIVTSWEK